MRVLISKTESDAAQSVVWLDGKVVHKVSRAFDYIAEHEATIASTMEMLGSRHFPHYLGTKVMFATPGKKGAIPSTLRTQTASIPKLVTLWEYVQGEVLGEFLKRQDVSEKVLVNCVLQVLYLLEELRSKIKFVHGDLHTNNIIITPSEDSSPFEYTIAGRKEALENLGFTVKMIDFGNAIIWSEMPLLATPLYSYKGGDINLQYDETLDTRVFGSTIIEELWNNRRGDYTSMLKKAYNNLFSQFVNGARKFEDGRLYPQINVYEVIYESLAEINDGLGWQNKTGCGILHEEPPTFLDLLLPLVKLPITGTDVSWSEDSEGDILSEDELLDKCIKFLTSSGMFAKFLKKWAYYEALCTPHQARHLLHSMVVLISGGQASEQAFFKLLNEKLEEFGQNKIRLKMTDTSKLYYYLMEVGEILEELISKLTAEYFQALAKYTKTTLILSQHIAGCSSVGEALIKIIDKIYKTM